MPPKPDSFARAIPGGKLSMSHLAAGTLPHLEHGQLSRDIKRQMRPVPLYAPARARKRLKCRRSFLGLWRALKGAPAAAQLGFTERLATTAQLHDTDIDAQVS